jgi:hypothetical protein
MFKSKQRLIIGILVIGFVLILLFWINRNSSEEVTLDIPAPNVELDKPVEPINELESLK